MKLGFNSVNMNEAKKAGNDWSKYWDAACLDNGIDGILIGSSTLHVRIEGIKTFGNWPGTMWH